MTWKHPAEDAPRQVGLAVRAYDVLDQGRWLEVSAGGVSNRSAHSSRLRADLRDALGEACAHSDRAFSGAFDRLEYLILLVYLDLSGKEDVITASTFLAQGWSGSELRRDLDRVAAQAAVAMADPQWPMLAAGAFGGAPDRARAAAAKLATMIRGGA
ncbi:hypothetical protein P3T35_007866 [Kitasatospora sp. GP30]|uniref:hypothetical protein n=1 Tax=Kitasatospora sp. GP30 TaxID=3035084 RepID=UPI000C70FD6E|nr:hypothetical protein [Kitasatospora sp. GP30]MDH6145805.1 hypothetical protein [Kitasatospora sp. GP30]